MQYVFLQPGEVSAEVRVEKMYKGVEEAAFGESSLLNISFSIYLYQALNV